jgi:hypothetical protein
VDYVVRPLPAVTVRLASAERSVQDEFQRIASILALNPYPNPQFPLVTEDWLDDGSKLFTYSDDDFPYAIQYVIFEPDDDNYGSISIIDLVELRPR